VIRKPLNTKNNVTANDPVGIMTCSKTPNGVLISWRGKKCHIRTRDTANALTESRLFRYFIAIGHQNNQYSPYCDKNQPDSV
jgi:hypothetical protein